MEFLFQHVSYSSLVFEWGYSKAQRSPLNKQFKINNLSYFHILHFTLFGSLNLLEYADMGREKESALKAFGQRQMSYNRPRQVQIKQ